MPYILEDETLRSEAIKDINKVFANSKVILVCNKDLMELDIFLILGIFYKDSSKKSINNTIPYSKHLLISILICDWNIRK